MVKVTINYDKNSQTFIGADEHGNSVTYKADRIANDAIAIGNSSTLGPMVSLLMACGACSGIDVVLILEKQRQILHNLEIQIIGEREIDLTPALWKEIHLKFLLKGDLDINKVEKAISLSIDKYCSVLETLRRAGATVTYQYSINN